MSEKTVFITLAGALSAVVILAAYSATKEKEKWEVFAKENNCVCIAEVSSKTIPIDGFDSKGNYTHSTAFVPGTKTYRCKDGKTYTR
jgi:hypothetical protein